MAKILVITDFDFTASGYKNIAESLMREMAGKGHEIKIIGLFYKGEQHYNPFSVLPSANIFDAVHQAGNLATMWNPDIFLVMLDIPLQIYFFNALPMYQDRHVAITPLENGPLTMTWAAELIRFPAVLFISELGKIEAQKAGLQNVDHIQIGIDFNNEWRFVTPDERARIRQGLGFDHTNFIVLTVAHNQERKNLWAALSVTRRLKDILPYGASVRHIMVTNETSEVGWNLRDLATGMQMAQELVIYKKGMPQKDLWSLYASADAFLLTSKAEGLGLPVLESFSTGVPVVATDTGALHELLSDGRGVLIEPEYTFIDVWGNSKRDMISIQDAADALLWIASHPTPYVANARKYIEQRTWSVAADKLEGTIRKVIDGKKS